MIIPKSFEVFFSYKPASILNLTRYNKAKNVSLELRIMF